jgi:nicotinate-nucleotide adenylyltransferase
MSAKRIGLLGGSFNPAHAGHRKLSLEAIKALDLQELWWLVSPGNPLKEGAPDMAPFEARMASARAVAAGSVIKVSDFESAAGTRYTTDTLAKLVLRYPQHRFIWLMGADSVAQFHRWKRWRRIAQLVPIAVFPRSGYDAAARAARAMGWLRWFVHPASQAKGWTDWSLPAITFLRLPTSPVSSTALRAFDPDWYRRRRFAEAAVPRSRRALASPL